MKVKEYNLVQENIVNFELQVREAIVEGWQPLGGVAISQDEGGLVKYAQAIVKYDVAK